MRSTCLPTTTRHIVRDRALSSCSFVGFDAVAAEPRVASLPTRDGNSGTETVTFVFSL